MPDTRVNDSELAVFESSTHQASQTKGGVRSGIASYLVPEILRQVIEYATYVPDERDDKSFWLHRYEWEAMMLDENRSNSLRQYAAVNSWWRSVIYICFPADVQCQTTQQMERAVEALIERERRSVRTLIWDHDPSILSNLSNLSPFTTYEGFPTQTTQTGVLERFLKRVDTSTMKALTLNLVMLEPLFNFGIYKGWSNITYFAYGSEDLPGCFYIITSLLREFCNLQSLLFLSIGGLSIPCLLPPRPTYSLKTFSVSSMYDSELIRWSAGNSRTTLEELSWLTCVYPGIFEEDLSDVFPGDEELQIRRLQIDVDDIKLVNYCDLDLLVWLQVGDCSDGLKSFPWTDEVLDKLPKCKALERLWLDIQDVPLLRGLLDYLQACAWPALVFLQVSISIASYTPAEKAEACILFELLEAVCHQRNVELLISL